MHREDRADFFLEFRYFQPGGLDRDQQNSDIPVVLDAYQNRIADAVDLSDPMLDRSRRNLDAADIQDFVDTAMQQQFSARRLTAQIVRLKPAVDETRLRQLRIVEVTMRHHVVTNSDASDLPREDVVAGFIDDARFGTWFQRPDV